MTAFVFNADDAIVFPPFFAFIRVHWRSSAVETHVFSPFCVWLTLRSGHGDPLRVHLLRAGLRTSFRAEPLLSLTDVSGCESPLTEQSAKWSNY